MIEDPAGMKLRDREREAKRNMEQTRKADSPDEPYFTMEWKNNDVFQCRGLHNCDMTPDVKAFTQAFKKKMLDSIKKCRTKNGGVVNAR